MWTRSLAALLGSTSCTHRTGERTVADQRVQLYLGQKLALVLHDAPQLRLREGVLTGATAPTQLQSHLLGTPELRWSRGDERGSAASKQRSSVVPSDVRHRVAPRCHRLPLLLGTLARAVDNPCPFKSPPFVAHAANLPRCGISRESLLKPPPCVQPLLCVCVL